MSQQFDATSPQATDYGPRLRRRWWVVVLGVLLGIGAALAFTAAQPTTYDSTTSVLVQSAAASGPTGSTTTPRSDINMETEATLVASEQVATGARDLLKTKTSPTDLLAQLSTVIPPNSQVLQITYSDATATSAQAGAQAFAQAYLGYRSGEAKKALDAANTSLKGDLVQAQADLKTATDKIAALPANSADRIYAEAQRTILANTISTLAARQSALDATLPIAGQVISAADRPDSPSSPVVALNLAAGIVVGLLLGLALAVLADRLDHRLRSAGDLPRRTGLPVLAVLPAKGVDDASYDRMRNTLTGSHGGGARILQVSDVGDHGASGPVALRLTQSLVRSLGEATLVVASTASPIGAWPALVGVDGLSEVLRGSASMADVRTPVDDLPGVWVVPPGRDPHALETLLQSLELSGALEQLLGTSPAVVLETAGTGRSAGAQAVSEVADAVVLVAERGRTDDRELSDAAEGARQMGGRVAGAVLASHARAARAGRSADDPAEAEPAVSPRRPDGVAPVPTQAADTRSERPSDTEHGTAHAAAGLGTAPATTGLPGAPPA